MLCEFRKQWNIIVSVQNRPIKSPRILASRYLLDEEFPQTKKHKLKSKLFATTARLTKKYHTDTETLWLYAELTR